MTKIVEKIVLLTPEDRPVRPVSKPKPNVIVGTDGNDRLIGTSGADIIRGRDGDDVLRTTKGSDRLLGGRGSDLYFVDSGSVGTVVRDNGGKNDRLLQVVDSVKDTRLLRVGGDLVIAKDVSTTVKLAPGAMLPALSPITTVKGWFSKPNARIEQITISNRAKRGQKGEDITLSVRDVNKLAIDIASFGGTIFGGGLSPKYLAGTDPKSATPTLAAGLS